MEPVGNHFILVLCDYATRYPPEVVALWSTDTENIMEVLVKFFYRVGISREIFTDRLVTLFHGY